MLHIPTADTHIHIHTDSTPSQKYYAHTKILSSHTDTQFWSHEDPEEAYYGLKLIKAAGSQRSVLGPLIYLLFTCDIP